MRRQRTRLVAFALAAAAALPATAAAQQQLNGRYTLDRQASDDIPAAINAAVARMNFVTRPIARGRLTRTNPAYGHVTLSYGPERVSVQFDDRSPIVTPANGSSVRWRREDGEMFDVSTAWQNDRLTQTFNAEDGRRVNVYSLSPDGGTLTMDITLTSPRLTAPLHYKLVFNRAS